MILSWSRRFLFIKSMKTASTSIEVALARHCDEHDVVTKIDRRDLETTARGHTPRNYEAGYYNHMPLHEVLTRAPEAQGFFRFTAERNPWDKVVSLYYYARGLGLDLPFQDWVLQIDRNGQFPLNWPLYTVDGRIAVDTIIRYEQLEADFAQVCDRLGIPREPLPRVKGQYRDPKATYRAHFDPELRDIVARHYQREIELFGYEF